MAHSLKRPTGKRRIAVLVGGAVAIALLGTAAAIHARRQDGRGFGPPNASGFFGLLDTNNDGVLAAAEIDGAAGVPRGSDRNGDGRLAADEWPPTGRGGPGGRGGGGRGEGRGGGRGEGPGEAQGPTADELVETLMAFDANNDGKLTRAEVPERMQGLFDRADADKNGELTADEIRKSATASEQTAPAGPGGRGPGGEFGGRGGRGGRGFGRDPLTAALDPNNDGVLAAEEITGAPAAIRSLDRNRDGAVSRDELFGFGRGGRRGGGDRRESVAI